MFVQEDDVTDRERAEVFVNRDDLPDHLVTAGGALQLLNMLAAEFAAVREPLERRVAALEAALRDADARITNTAHMPSYEAGRAVAAIQDHIRAALSGGTAHEGKEAGA